MDWAFYYALRYHVTRNEADARRAVALLTRFAEVVPRWPIRDREGRLQAQDDRVYTVRWDSNGLWGDWFYFDPERSLPWLWAWDLAGPSEAMRAPGVSARIEKDLLRFVVERQFENPPGYGNMDASLLEGVISFGRLLPEPEYIHRVARWARAILITGFYADGFWHEGTPAYHAQIVGHLKSVFRMLKGYSDPPGFTSAQDGTRFDNLDLIAKYAVQFRRADEALQKLVLPDGSMVGLHDAYPPEYRYPRSYRPNAGRPTLLGATGQAALGTGEGAGQTLAHLHFAGMHGHHHKDALSIILWAKQTELFSETMYRPLPGDASTREWHEATAAHNTVVIDGEDQSREQKPLTPDDAVAGIPDGRYRALGHGNTISDGKLLMFAEGASGNVQVAEASAERSYHPRPEVYRRTIALVKTGSTDAYVFDVFRVRGGKVHDWMLHGCLHKPYEIQFDRPLLPRAGTLHKYLKNLRVAQADSPVVVEIKTESGASTRTFLMDEPGMEIIDAVGPAMRRKGPSHFVDIRHPGPESLFVAVHEPIGGEPIIKRVEFRRCGPMAVAARIELADGRTDFIVSTMDDANDPVRQVEPWNLSLRGRFAHARLSPDGKPQALDLIRGESFTVADRTLTGANPFTGEILAASRTEDAAPRDTLTTKTSLPLGEALRGRAVMMDLGGALVQTVTVDRIDSDSDGGRAVIVSREDPGVTIADGLIKLQHFPNWGIRGRCLFLVENPRAWKNGGD